MMMVRQGYKNPSSSPLGGLHFKGGISEGLWSSSSSTGHLISIILAMEKWIHFDLQASEGIHSVAVSVPCSEAPGSALVLALYYACKYMSVDAIICLVHLKFNRKPILTLPSWGLQGCPAL